MLLLLGENHFFINTSDFFVNLLVKFKKGILMIFPVLKMLHYSTYLHLVVYTYKNPLKYIVSGLF